MAYSEMSRSCHILGKIVHRTGTTLIQNRSRMQTGSQRVVQSLVPPVLQVTECLIWQYDANDHCL